MGCSGEVGPVPCEPTPCVGLPPCPVSPPQPCPVPPPQPCPVPPPQQCPVPPPQQCPVPPPQQCPVPPPQPCPVPPPQQCPVPPPQPCPGRLEHATGGRADPPGVPCPQVDDTGPGPGAELAACPATPGRLTTQQTAQRPRWQSDLATDGVRRRLQYETLPDHLQGLAMSEILASDRFKSTAAASYTQKSRDLCLNPEPIVSQAPPSGDVHYLKETEERVRRATLPSDRPRFSEYGEAFQPRRLAACDMVGQVKLMRPGRCLPTTDVLPKHVYTARDGVAGQVNPYLSTTCRDFAPISAEAARKYRDVPAGDKCAADAIIPPVAAPMPRWHGFTPTVPNAGLQSETQARYCRPRLVADSGHNWSVPVAAPLAVPPTTRQLMPQPVLDRESCGYGTGRHNAVALSCDGLVTRQKCRRRLCNVDYGDWQPDARACPRTKGPADRVEQVPAVPQNISDNHFGLATGVPPPNKPDVN